MISVVIPALNEEQYLPSCLGSLKSQNWNGQYEIVVVDNGSTDNTAAVAARFGARVVRCPRRGVAYARQAGGEAAKGDIVVQADADTTYPPNWLDRIELYFSRHPGSAALAGRYTYIESAWWAPMETGYRRTLNWLSLVFLRWPASVSGANFAFRREAFIKAGGYDPLSLYPDQWGIARRLSRFGRVDYDHGSVVATSSRRVVKPAIVISYEIIRNMLHVTTHFFKHCFHVVSGQERKPKTA